MKSQLSSTKQKVFVGVSGGVDSSVALALLKNQGYDVTGVFLKVWHPEFLPCNWKEERRSAMRVCATLGVPFLTLDCQNEYKKEVVDYMISEYKNGRTPNPDVFCNKYVKFGVFLKKALEMGADFVGTGHYAQINEITNGSTNYYELKEGKDDNKDQSYFLYTLNQNQLSHTLFPVGNLTKPEVRKLADKFNLPTAEKKDSQGVCFLEDLDIKDFLSHYIKTKKGDVLNTKGETIGFHNGAILYTIGERHGYNIVKKTTNEPRYFIISKDLKNNTITVANKIDDKNKVFSVNEITLNDIHFISEIFPTFPLKCQIRIRYRQKKQKCTLIKYDNKYKIIFEKPQNGVASGQSAVLYKDVICLGGGIITDVR